MVPMALIGTLEVLPMHSLNVRPGRVILRFGEPIPTEGLKLHDREMLTQQLQDRVSELLNKSEKDSFAPATPA